MEQSDKLYARALRSASVASLLLGLTFIWKVVNREFQLYMPASIFVLIALFTFLFFSLRMLNVGPQTWASRLTWIGMALLASAETFKTDSFPGCSVLMLFGGTSVIGVIAAILYLRKLPQEQQWAKNALGWWVIALQVIGLALWLVTLFYGNQVSDGFPPAIPYSDYCVEYMRNYELKIRVYTLGNGIALLIFSLPLYIVARKHCK